MTNALVKVRIIILGSEAFIECGNLSSIMGFASVKKMENMTFVGCDKLIIKYQLVLMQNNRKKEQYYF